MTRTKKILLAGIVALSGIALLGIVLASFYAPITSQGWEFESCDRCGAMRVTHTVVRMSVLASSGSELIYSTDRSLTCTHAWTSGIPGGVVAKPGHVLLLRQGDAFGAVIFEDMDDENYEASIRYAYRTDGHGDLSPTNPSVTVGTDQGHDFEFGPFYMLPGFRLESFPPRIHYSLIADRDGTFQHFFIDYPRRPLEELHHDDLAICATELTSFEGLDAAAP